MDALKNHWIDSAKPTEKELALAIASFLIKQPTRSATEEEIQTFVDQFSRELIGARFIYGAMDLLNRGELCVCWKDNEIAWSLPNEEEKKELMRCHRQIIAE